MRPRLTGSLRLRRRVWWARYYHNGELVEVSTKQTDKAKAAKVLREKLRTADTPRFVAPAAERVTFEDLCQLIRQDYVEKGNRSDIGTELTHLAEAFAGQTAMSITTKAVKDYVAQRLQERGARATINRELAALRRMFHLAMGDGLVPSMPTISTPKENNVREGFLDPPEFAALLAALRIEDPDVADLTEFAYRTVLRRGNVVGAVWPWFTLKVEAGHVGGGSMRVPGTATKNKKPLSLPLQGDLLALIDRRWKLRVPTCAYVFHHAGVPLRRFDDAWRRAAAAIGQPTLLFHDLRRSSARTLRRRKVDQQTIMRMGGWKTPSMFTRYSIVDEQDLADAQAQLDIALGTSVPPTIVPLRRKMRRKP
jgi:integrase